MVGTDAIGWGAGNQVGAPGTPIGFASLLGGWANTASGDYSSIVGGAENTANNCGTFVGGGGIDIPQCAINAGCGTPLGTFSGNTASGISAAVVGGAGNGAVSDLAFVGGGRNNTAGGGGGITQTVGGGEHNQALGDGATICGGEQNTATDIHSSICGGFGNFIGNVLGHQHIGGGLMNRSNSGFTVIGGGANNINNANYSAILGGQGNLTNAVYSAASGFMAVTQQYGQHAQASGQIAVQGDAQTSVYVERGQTTPGVPTNLTLDGGATELVVPANFSMSLRIEIICRDNAVPANSSSFFIDGVANYLNPGPGACVATGPVVQYNCGFMPATFVAVAAVAGTNIIRITVNSGAPNVNWVARIQTAEVKL
jgi:hypothetical protein